MTDLVREILIDATADTIFPFLTNAERWLEWQGTEAEIDARPGGAYRVLIAGAYLSVGEFVEVVPNEKVVFTFGWDVEGNPITPGSTTVTMTLQPEGSKTLLRMVHSGLPDDQAVLDHGEGWSHYLERLDVVVGGGTVPVDAPEGGPRGSHE
jgi:uncharacterized protein YndB with AHSA1/START domain